MSEFQFRRDGRLIYLVCLPLERAGFVHAFSTRLGGVSSLPDGALNLGFVPDDTPTNVRENRRRFLAAIGATGMRLITAQQVHSSTVRIMSSAEPSPGLQESVSDALVTGEVGWLLAVQTADCLPILIADATRRIVAAVHAGWRGSLAGIAEKTIIRMREEFGTRPEDCLAALGPAAQACCYEVGREVVESFRSRFDDADRFISSRESDGRWYLDLELSNVRQLIGAGLRPENIFPSSLCTICRQDLFFSHRRDSRQGVGRMMSVIGISRTPSPEQPSR